MKKQPKYLEALLKSAGSFPADENEWHDLILGVKEIEQEKLQEALYKISCFHVLQRTIYKIFKRNNSLHLIKKSDYARADIDDSCFLIGFNKANFSVSICDRKIVVPKRLCLSRAFLNMPS